MPPPRAHRHRYYGVLAPNASLRVAVTALAPVAIAPSPPPADATQTQEEPPHRAAARYLWARLLARIYSAKQVPWRDEALPLSCPICHREMRIIAFINEPSTVRKILDHIGEATQPPPITPARGPPLWQAAAASEQADNDPQWDRSAQPGPHIEFDQRIAW